MSNPDDLVQLNYQGRLVKMPRSLAEEAAKPDVTVTVDGKSVTVPRVSITDDPTGRPIPRLTTIYDAAARVGVNIPVLCHREYMNPIAVCRVCSVQVKFKDDKTGDVRAEWKLAPGCYRPVEPGMVVETHQTNERVKTSVKTLTELLMADHPSPCAKQKQYGDCELETLAQRLGVQQVRVPPRREARPLDDSSQVIAVDHNACILCDRCIRGCNDIRDNQVLGRQLKGYKAGIAFDLNTPMGESSCVACGECMISCPTGALTNKSVVQPEPWKKAGPAVQPVPAEELARHPLFEGVAHPFLRFNEGAVVRRRYRDGEVICREGEFGSTAYYIESGRVEVSIQTPLRHVKSSFKPSGFLRKFSSILASRKDDRREEENDTRYIHIDAPVALEYGSGNEKPVAELGAGELFGEMTCLSNYPRSATVRAKGDVVVLELLRNVLYILQRSNKSKRMLEEKYRKRAIDSHLKSVPLFSGLIQNEAQFKEFVEYLRPRVELMRLNPGDVLFRQGDPADGFYMVRIGFVKVSQSHPGGEHVLTYKGPGEYFGEVGLMTHLPELQGLTAANRRTATCSALDHVDLVKIKSKDFQTILERYPEVRQHLVGEAKRYIEENERTRQHVEGVPLGEFLRQGLQNAQSLLVLDLTKCTRCDECTKACADAHDGVTRLIREGLRFGNHLVASSCRSCLDPYCMVGCPVGSIRRRNSREIIIEDWCIGCGKCAENCPYGNINMHPFPTGEYEGGKAVVQQKATMCDLCSDLRDGQPSCVYACPHDAAHRMTGIKFLEAVERE